MPTFRLNKLIRDKLEQEYIKLHHIATYKTLNDMELVDALKQKIIEEAHEIPVEGTREDIIGEIADVEQVLEDLAKHFGIKQSDITQAKRQKFERKGGFSKGLFVEQVEIPDDEWAAYYRSKPSLFPEIGEAHTVQDVPLIEAGVYEHYKGKQYEVVGVGLDSESSKPVVVYIPLYESTIPLFVRPYEMFLEFVDVDGTKVRRFEKRDV